MHQMIAATRRQHRIQWLLVILLLALLGGALAYLVFNERDRLLQRESKRLLDQARVVDENIGHQLIGVRKDMAHFAADGMQTAASRQLTALSAAMLFSPSSWPKYGPMPAATLPASSPSRWTLSISRSCCARCFMRPTCAPRWRTETARY